MNPLVSPWAIMAVCSLIILGLLASPNAVLWATSLLALPVAVWLLGGRQAYRVLLWVIAINWLQVIGDVASADLTGSVLSDGSLGPYRVEAILWSLCAILTLALGMRFGTQLGGWLFRSFVHAGSGSPAGAQRVVRLHRVMLCYFASLVMTKILGAVAASVPALAQPVLALTLIKFVCVYLVAADSIGIGTRVRLASSGLPCGGGDRADGVLRKLQGSIHRRVDRFGVEPAPGECPNVDLRRGGRGRGGLGLLGLDRRQEGVSLPRSQLSVRAAT